MGNLAPSVGGQAAAISEALPLANVRADSLGLIECHGTGTAMGDPIEIAALREAFEASSERRGYCAVGPAKSNIGHLDTAACVVALIKAALALKHAELPPSINFETPNPEIAFERTPFFVNTQAKPWPRGQGPRRAGVNSLGVGGTNAFVILEESPARAQPSSQESRLRLLLLSARNPRSLAQQQRRAQGRAGRKQRAVGRAQRRSRLGAVRPSHARRHGGHAGHRLPAADGCRLAQPRAAAAVRVAASGVPAAVDRSGRQRAAGAPAPAAR